MKKTLIASAIAAATLSTGAFAEGGLGIYGSVEAAYTHTDNGDDVTTNGVDDNGSTLGFKHSHKISEEVTGFAKIEFEFDADQDAAGLDQTDEIYIGMKGGFGSIQYGVDDSVYEWVDVVDTSENTGISGELLAGASELETIQYVSPEIADGLVIGATIPAESQSTFGGALAAKYAADNLEVVLAYAMGRIEGGAEAGDTLGLAATFSMDDLTLMGQFESRGEGADGAEDGEDFIGLQAMYTMGQNQFALGYGMSSFEPDGAEDEATIALQALHNLSDHMYMYVEYTMSTDLGGVEDNDLDTLALGAAYTF